MNKTIIININGAVFHIEEDAYEILKNYMTDVKRHFLNSADSLEITTDIENRIAEMFNDILARENKQVIVEGDVKQVIEQMGTVDDFEHVEEDTKATNTNTHSYSSERTLFRDPDDHLVAGVCSGLANYFSIDPVWVRLAFALAVVFGGTGFILYLILWLVIPKAVTRADRMAMRGEKLNLQGFKNNFEEELNAMHGHLSDLQAEAKPLIYKTRDLFGAFFYNLGLFLNQTGRLIVKILGILLLLVCFGAAIALIVCFVWATVWGGEVVDIFPFSVISNGYADRIYASAFLLAFIPVVAIILLIIKGIFHTRAIGRSSGSVMLAIWLCALVVTVYYGSKISAGFRESASFTRTIEIQPTKNGTYYLKLNDLKYFSHDDSVHLDMKNNFHDMIVRDDDYNGFHGEPHSVDIKIEKSDITQPVLEESFRAKGRDYNDALLNARNTSYIYTQQDSVLKFDYRLHRNPAVQWHAEEISLILKVPLNAKLIIDKKLDRYLNDINLYTCDNMQNERSAPAVFVMTDNGLQCNMDTLAKAAADTAKKVKRKK